MFKNVLLFQVIKLEFIWGTDAEGVKAEAFL